QLPTHLFFSGHAAPSVPDLKPPRHLLPPEEFFNELRRMGGMPDEILQSTDLMLLFEPIIRADLRAVYNFTYHKSTPFDIPITIMIGKDEDITDEDVLKWQDETLRRIKIVYVDGGHFFIQTHPLLIIDEITRTLKDLVCHY